jgi:hypothetical protein
MKNLIRLLAITLLFSCAEKVEETDSNILENLTYSMDTVIVDSGEDMFVLSHGLGENALNEDKSKLLFFENEPLNLVEVDLTNLKLVGKEPFQREGPDGVGPYWVRFQLRADGALFVRGYNTQGIFNRSGKLIETLKVVPEGIDAELASNFPELYANTVFDFEKNRIYTQPSAQYLKKNELFIIDPLTKGVRIEPIPEMKVVEDFSRTLMTGSMINFFAVGSHMSIQNRQLLLSAEPMSGIYHLDLNTDSLEFIAIQHRGFPNRMEFALNIASDDEAVFNEDARKVAAHLNYMEPRWDETREMYLRLGRKTFLGEKPDDPSSFEVFLFAYDADFNVLGETKIEGLDQVPGSYFWKDGKLWNYVNVDDELGFAVFTFDF